MIKNGEIKNFFEAPEVETRDNRDSFWLIVN